MGPIVLLLVVVVAVAAAPAVAELPRLEHSPKADGSLSILAVGDWGRRGEFNQSRVATQMGVVAEKMDADFVISTGDNFYSDGLTGVNDMAFEDSFTGIYTAKSLQKPWYTVLGNHDYRGDALAQTSPVLAKVDRRWICIKSFILNAEIADFFFVDTTPFVLKYWTNPGNSTYDWRGVAPRDTYITNLLKDVEALLRQSRAPWKIVVGHHPIRTAGKHGDTEELVQLLLPMLKANGVDLYVNGHDHCLEQISSSDRSAQYLTSGGGSKAWGGVYAPGADKVEFFHDGQGFMSLRLTATDARLAFYDVAGAVRHTWGHTKAAHY
uniref:Purple acid phosphatase n=1 Tax=Aegilops tauschii subsp. strangulata TaxID=200361 RepID=A0A453B178_AEGTS